MSHAEKVMNNIIFVLKSLIKYLKKKGKLELIQQGNVNEITDILYELYNIDSRYLSKVADAVDKVVYPKHKASIDREIAAYKEALDETAMLVTKREKDSKKMVSLKSASGTIWNIIEPKGANTIKNMIGSKLYINCKTKHLADLVIFLVDKMLNELLRKKRCPHCGRTEEPLTNDKALRLRCSCGNFFKTYPAQIKFLNHFLLGNADRYQLFLRADKVIIYVIDNPAILTGLAGWLAEFGADKFNPTTPLFTKEIMNGVGFASEPTDKQASKHGFKNFGSIMCKIIAESLILAYKEHQRLPFGEDFVDLADYIYHEELVKKNQLMT